MKSSLSSLFSTMRYCVARSWRSSKWYTLVRLLGKIITPAGRIDEVREQLLASGSYRIWIERNLGGDTSLRISLEPLETNKN